MRSRYLINGASASLLLTASLVNASLHRVHNHLDVIHKRHRSHRDHVRSTAEQRSKDFEMRSALLNITAPEAELKKRGGQCQFPTGAGLVPVTIDDENAGWAMSPNQQCTPGSYCPYACPPGEVMMQWDPAATSYSYPESMNGGLYCDDDGNISKPFPNNPYCQSTSAIIGVQNNAGSVVSFCQTVLPGNEAMLIPNAITSWTQLAVPDPTYWCGTAAHYYINPPGTTTDVACVWGTNASPVGNWSPYVAGANTDSNGNTFVKLGWNPIYLETTTPFRDTMPSWGVAIECDGDGCNGLPCAIDPSQNGVNEMVGSSSDGAGGGAFCVVTVPKGVTANFVVTNGGGSSSTSTSSSSSSSSSESTTTDAATTTTTTSTSSSSSESSWSGAAAPSFSAVTEANGGQFYQSETSATTTPTSTTTATTAISTSVSDSSVSHWSASSSAITTHTNSSSSVSTYAPTHSPYYSLFNHTVQTGNGEVATSFATATGPSVAASSLPATGGVAAVQISTAGLVLSLLASILSLCT